MGNRNIIFTHSVSTYTQEGTSLITSIISQNASQDAIHIALTGGTSPIPIYTSLSGYASAFERVHFWWSDERYLPLDHFDSNYKQSYDTFIKKLHIPQPHLHPVPVEHSLTQATKLYASEIKEHVPEEKFDLILLGIGPDGHTASLFPGTQEGENNGHHSLVPIFNSPKPPPQRISFTFNLINKAKNILVCVKGKDRVAMVQSWLEGQPSSLPFTHIKSKEGNTYWLLTE